MGKKNDDDLNITETKVTTEDNAEEQHNGLAEVLERLAQMEEENKRMRAELDNTKKDMQKAQKKAEETEKEELTEGRKQALMERKFHETMEQAKADTVTLTLPLDTSGEDDDVFVCVNGYRYLIRRGEEVEVPRFVAEALKNSEAQKLTATRHMRKLQEKARK